MTPEKCRRYIWGIQSCSMVIIVDSRSLDKSFVLFLLDELLLMELSGDVMHFSSDSTGWRGLVS